MSGKQSVLPSDVAKRVRQVRSIESVADLFDAMTQNDETQEFVIDVATVSGTRFRRDASFVVMFREHHPQDEDKDKMFELVRAVSDKQDERTFYRLRRVIISGPGIDEYLGASGIGYIGVTRDLQINIFRDRVPGQVHRRVREIPTFRVQGVRSFDVTALADAS